MDGYNSDPQWNAMEQLYSPVKTNAKWSGTQLSHSVYAPVGSGVEDTNAGAVTSFTVINAVCGTFQVGDNSYISDYACAVVVGTNIRPSLCDALQCIFKNVYPKYGFTPDSDSTWPFQAFHDSVNISSLTVT